MKTAIVALPIVASALLVAIVVILLWMAGSVSGERARFSSLEIAPKEADIFVAVNTDPTSPQWLAVNNSLDAINAKDPIRRAIDEALAEVNLDFDEDILPVAGDEAFFSVPDISKVEDGGYVAGFRLRDTAKAQEVFDSLRQRAEDEGEEFEVEEYEGVTIYYTEKPTPGCTVDAEGTAFCDGEVPAPEPPEIRCMNLSLEGVEASEAPTECVPFYECPMYGIGPGTEDNWDDVDGDGALDSCAEATGIEQQWIDGIAEAIANDDRYQDCADLEDISDYQCGIVSTLASASGAAVALFEDVLAVGASPDDVKDVIDVVQGRAPGANENERLQEFRAIQKDEFLVWGYADLGSMWDTLGESIAAGLESDGGFEDLELDVATATPALARAPETDFRVPTFDADYRVVDGALHVTERITVDYGDTPKHGIYREFATRVGYDFANDESITYSTVSVTRDGVPEPFAETYVGDFYKVKFGDPNVTITGQHTYDFEYTVIGGIRQSVWGRPDAHYEIRWIATGAQWPVPIEQSSVTVTIPAGTIESTDCFVGRGEFGIDGYMSCQDSHDGLTARFVPDAPIEPGAGLHFVIGVNGESGAPPPVLVPAQDPSFENESPTYEELKEDLPFDFNSEALFEEMRGTYDRVGFSISAAGDGFALDLTVLHAPGFEPKYAIEPTQAFDSHFAGSVPADTMFFFAGFDLYGQVKSLGDYFEQIAPSDGPSGGDFLDGFTDATGLDLEEDVLSLFTGEYAIAGNVSGFEKDPPDFSILALIDVADAAKAEDALEAIGDYLEDESLVDIDDSQSVQRWSVEGDSGIEALGMTVDTGALIAGYPYNAVEDTVDGITESLADTQDWQRTLQLLPEDTTSIGFVSLARIFEELRGTEWEDSFNESTDGEVTLEDLAAIRSVGFATTSRDNGFGMHFVVFMEER